MCTAYLALPLIALSLISRPLISRPIQHHPQHHSRPHITISIIRNKWIQSFFMKPNNQWTNLKPPFFTTHELYHQIIPCLTRGLTIFHRKTVQSNPWPSPPSSGTFSHFLFCLPIYIRLVKSSLLPTPAPHPKNQTKQIKRYIQKRGKK